MMSGVASRVARGIVPHAPAVCVFALAALAWTYPLVLHLGDAIPGGGAGDNVTSLWNVWWFRHALWSGENPFFTHHLFAPFGVDLTLHTHTATLGVIGATILARVPLIVSFNLLVVGCLAANGLGAYLLAYSTTRDRASSVLAGLVFGGSPYFMAHLQGHLSLLAGCGLPLLVLAVQRAHRTRARAWSIEAALLLVLIAYTDYYYVVYGAVLAGIAVLATVVSVEVRARSSSRASVVTRRALSIAGWMVLAAGLAIAVTGGGRIEVAGIPISMKKPTNTLTAGWGLLAIAFVVGTGRRLHAVVLPGAVGRAARLWLPAGVVLVLGLAPIAWRASALAMHGDYARPAHTWRSSAAGVDALALVTGNPQQPWWGAPSRALHDAAGIDPVEDAAWLGVVPIALLGLAWARRDAHDARVLRWSAVAAVFVAWALGPFLLAGGFNTGVLLPTFVLRFVPVIENARMPGRAMVVVYLAVAMLCALMAAHLGRRWAWLPWMLGALVFVDYLAAPFPLHALGVPAAYAPLVQNTDRRAVLLELPFGLRDGFGEAGQLDHDAFYWQSLHEHPIAGGFVARLSPRLRASIQGDPTLGPLLALSGSNATGSAVPAVPGLHAGLRRLGIGFVVLDLSRASAPLAAMVHAEPGLRRVTSDGRRELYAVMP